MLGFDLMPRIRNWEELTFYRPTKQTEYVHIDALFDEPARNVIDFDLRTPGRHIPPRCCCVVCARAHARTPPTPPSVRSAV
ncbi:Tn3 family transposase [Streptomyces sp. NBC_00885]|uniref:Tn3 family transposase n=1 Tax=Streptomyces sp. NBC_00885 TaxID=2975857 RepID=UPI00386CEFBD